MRVIKQFSQFINEKKHIDHVKDIKISIEDLLSIIDDSELNLLTTFGIDGETVTEKDNISKLYSDSQFNKKLNNKKIKKGKLQDTKDNETLLDDNYILRFFFIYDKNSSELEEPNYIIIQYYNKKDNTISNIRVFENKESINKFYETLTNKTIEIKRCNKEFIYQTNNSGNNWELKNPNQTSGKFKSDLDFDEVDKLLKDKKVKLI